MEALSVNLVCKVLEVIVPGSNWGLQLATPSFVTNPQQKVFSPRAQLTSGIAQECVFPCLAAGTHTDTNPTRPATRKPSQDLSQHLHWRMVPASNHMSGVNILNCPECL